MDLVAKAYSIPDRESVETARLLLQKEGILGGSSSGTLLAAALRYCREQTEAKRVVSLVCDTGGKYLTKMFNEVWVAAHGFEDRPRHGDLRDLIARDFAEGGVISIGPGNTLLTAYNRMRAADISQLPVIDGGRLVGILDEGDILAAVGAGEGRADRFAAPVSTAMTGEVHTLQVHEPVDRLKAVFDRDEVAVVVDGDKLVGVITPVDLINHLRRMAQ